VKAPKWLRKIRDYLSEKRYKEARKKAALEKVLATLREHKHELKRRKKAATDPATLKKIEKALKVVHAQRKKGVKALQKMRSGSKD